MAESRYPYVHVSVTPAEAELASCELWDWGASGIEERDDSTLNTPDRGSALTLVASFAGEDDACAAAAALNERWPARVAFVEGNAWREAYKLYFKATRVGQRLVVRPPWEPYDAAPDDVVLTLDPGAAFGTGTHETTRLVLEALQQHVRAGMRVLDVGCGSGILAIATLLLGAASARAVDVDPEAVRVAGDNARANRVEARMHAQQVAGDTLAELGERYPLVLANIETRVLVPMARAIEERVEPGGVLILSGILSSERERVLSAYASLRTLSLHELGEWVALVLGKPAPGDQHG
jgi:ribosomal protein L11 methyltransferase